MEDLHAFILQFFAKRHDQTSKDGIKRENSSYCTLFFTLINEMLDKFMKENGQIIKTFSPSIIHCDEHLSNQNGIKAVFGQEFVENRTESCEYHFEKSTEKHLKLLPTEHYKSYKTLETSLKNAVAEETFIRVKAQFELFIKRQSNTYAKPLMDTLRFWKKVKPRWFQAYKKTSTIHNQA